MNRPDLLLFILFGLLASNEISGNSEGNSGSGQVTIIPPDTLRDNQNLYNGRIWKDLYYRIDGDQFLYSADFLPGSLTMNGITYNHMGIMYDIYKDEILTPIDRGGILQLNKEMIDSFSFSFQNKTFRFARIPENGQERLKGYVQVVYSGKSALYVKHTKKIDRPAVENKQGRFFQVSRIYFVKDSSEYVINKKSDLFRALGKDNEQVKGFIKKNKSGISGNRPESFIPVIRYYDSL
jgi:hypothetical protein